MNRATRRRWVDRGATVAALLLAFVAIWPLFSVLERVWSRGHGVVDLEFLTGLPEGPFLPGGGIKHAIVGTGLVVGLGTLYGAPIGLLTGIYLAEYGRGKFAEVVRTFTNALSGLPSILAGLFAYALAVRELGLGFSAYAGGVALAVLMIPVVTRTTEEALLTVPPTYREAALALGVPRWRAIVHVVVPAAIGPILTGILLSIARIAGETAPLLLTVLTSFFLVTDPSKPVATLPFLVYDYGKSAYPKLNDQAWGAALVLVACVLLVNLVVRLLSRRRPRWN